MGRVLGSKVDHRKRLKLMAFRGGRPHNTTRVTGSFVGDGHPRGTNQEAGYAVSDGRLRGTTHEAGFSVL